MKVLTGYIVAAGKEILKDNAVASVSELSTMIVEKYVRVLATPSFADHSDKVLTYSSEVITLGLLWHCYHDAVREGDGKRVLLIWKFLLIVYKAANRTNYCKEAAILLAQYYHLFSERKAEQLLFSRFINTQGRQGCNIPCDLHLEHLNRRLKTVLRNLRSNLQLNSILRAAKSIGVVNSICQQFERETTTGKSQQSNHHSIPPSNREVNLIVESLEGVSKLWTGLWTGLVDWTDGLD